MLCFEVLKCTHIRSVILEDNYLDKLFMCAFIRDVDFF